MEKNKLKKLADLVIENERIKKDFEIFKKAAASADNLDVFKIKITKDIVGIIESVLVKKFSKELEADRGVIVRNPVNEIIIKSILDQVMIKNWPNSFEISNLKDIKQREFPKSFAIKSQRLVEIKEQIELLVKSNKDLIGQLIKQGEETKEIKISNSKPEDAIPVVLTTADKQRFYNVMMQVLGAAGTDPKKLDSIVNNTRIPSVIGHGALTVAAAGTPGNLPNVACKRVIIQANEDNTGRIAVGGSNAVRAALAARNGVYLYKTWRQEFNVRNLNLLWIDAVVNGEGITYTYEN